jgi:predicted amidohydrolase YtcJ
MKMLPTPTDPCFLRRSWSATRNAARTYPDQVMKGTITDVQTADLVILDANPLTVAPEKISPSYSRNVCVDSCVRLKVL